MDRISCNISYCDKFCLRTIKAFFTIIKEPFPNLILLNMIIPLVVNRIYVKIKNFIVK